MLSKRNLAMMMMMFAVVLVLFLSSVVLKEYFNDYDVNHAAETELIEKIEQGADQEGDEDWDAISEERQILYIGTENNGYYSVIEEWAGYRKYPFQVFSSLDEAENVFLTTKGQKTYLLVDGELLEPNITEATDKLSQYVKQGGTVVFYRLPSYQTISNCGDLQNLLGIQILRGESVQLHEIRLYSGFLLGGETCYSFEGVKEPDTVDMERVIPWYDISSRTKSYMVGFLSAEEMTSLALNNEDMPAIIWRSNLGDGSVFAVNGDYMKGEASLGILDAMVYESEDYSLYEVVNAQNLLLTGFPDLTVENEEKMQEAYGMNTRQLCQDILWPSLVAAAQKGNWKLTSFVSVKQSDQTKKEPNRGDLVTYLKYFNEEFAEAGVSLGRMGSLDLRSSVEEDRNTLKLWNLEYVFAGGYVRKENKEQLSSLIGESGKPDFFEDIRTIVAEYEEEEPIFSWMTDKITLQNITANAYRYSQKDSFMLKSLETALGYSNIQIDIYQILWPESREYEWEQVAEKMSANIDTHWKPFAVFDKTTISESDRRVRNFLNGSVTSTRTGNSISIQTKNYTGDAYLLLRTHGEKPQEMTGGTWKRIEKDAYLLQLTSEQALVTLEQDVEAYYKY